MQHKSIKLVFTVIQTMVLDCQGNVPVPSGKVIECFFFFFFFFCFVLFFRVFLLKYLTEWHSPSSYKNWLPVTLPSTPLLSSFLHHSNLIDLLTLPGTCEALFHIGHLNSLCQETSSPQEYLNGNVAQENQSMS